MAITAPTRTRCDILSTIKIRVDTKQSIDLMIELGQYQWISEILLRRKLHYPHVPTQTSPILEARIALVQVQGDPEISSVEANALIQSSLGLVPIELLALLAIGIQYPHLQTEFPIVALGARTAINNCDYVFKLGTHRFSTTNTKAKALLHHRCDLPFFCANCLFPAFIPLDRD